MHLHCCPSKIQHEVIFCFISHPHYLQPHESKAFSSRASRPFQSFSFLTDPLLLLPLSQGLPFQPSSFLQSSLFSTCLLCTEHPPCSNQGIVLFYNPQLTKHRNNVSEWTLGTINVLHVTSERCSISTCKLYVLEIFNQLYAIFHISFAAWFLTERMGTKSLDGNRSSAQTEYMKLWKDCYEKAVCRWTRERKLAIASLIPMAIYLRC